MDGETKQIGLTLSETKQNYDDWLDETKQNAILRIHLQRCWGDQY